MKWSFSAHNIMRRCHRQLMFATIIASHSAKDPQRREAYILKQLQHLSTWLGDLVDEVLSNYMVPTLREGQPVDFDGLIHVAQDLARRQFAFSEAKRYREPKMTKTAAGEEYCALYEHEYELQLPRDSLHIVQGRLAECFSNLSSQQAFLKLLLTGSDYRPKPTISVPLDGLINT